MKELEFFFIKPDAVRRNLIGEILRRFEAGGLKIVALKMTVMTREQAEKLYDIHKGKPFFEKLVNYVTSGPVVVGVLEGEDAVRKAREIVGSTDPQKAKPGTIRRDFGISITENSVHAADSRERSSYEMSIFFSEKELLVSESEA